MRVLLVVVYLAIMLDYSLSQGPVWPEQFEQDFTEDLTYSFLKLKTKGHIAYDFTNKRYRLDRENGKGDRYCGSVYKFTDTACSHYVSEGKRYLHFPEKNDCCFCCDSVHGCGVLKPDWAADATFEELIISKDGIKTQKWNKVGLQANYIYQNQDTKIITGIEQVPNDFQHFIEASFRNGIIDPSRLELPSICSAEKTCPFFSLCTPLRAQVQKFE